jgi:DNA polymerase V
MFALVDCNNFYASCERVFHPQWKNRPIVVLSNNDGCIIARSNEAKALGIPMGAPFFQYKDLMEAHQVIVCSSNYSLYGDLSERVMQTLKPFAIDFQIYSIDEAFLRIGETHYEKFGLEIRKTVLQWVGIPVSIGIAPTKTLAKIANHKAKKERETRGVHVLDNPNAIDQALYALPVEEIWGIGHRRAVKLHRIGIRTAQEFRDAPDDLIKKHLTVNGLRTAWELRGISCLPLEEVPQPKKSITCSRAFGAPIDDLENLYEAVASYAARTGEKLRLQESLASSMTVFVELHPFNREASNAFHVRIVFPQPTDYTPHLIHYAKNAAKALFRPGQQYRKAGIIVDGLVPNQSYQQDLFAMRNASTSKQNTLMRVMDQLNEKFGHTVLCSAAEGTSKEWQMKRNLRTPHYTTQWDEILSIHI